MSRHQPYPSYKESGVEWLGEVPEHWVYFEGKRIFANRMQKANNEDEQLAATQKYGVIPQHMFMQQEEQKVVLALKGTDGFRHVEQSDFVISLRSFQGGIEFSYYSGCVSPAYTVLYSVKETHSNFYKYLFKSYPYIKALQSSTDSLREGKSITYSQFGNIAIPLPQMDEQTAIANFLDRETVNIDTLIAKQERMIELLGEKRSALISHAVTKGLDPNAKMKDSGIEWLGEVPEHWEVKKLKYNLRLQTKKVTIDGHNVIALENIESKSGKYVSTESSYQGEDVEFKAGDILFGKLRPYLAKVYKCNSNGVAFGDLLTYRPTEHFDSSFAFYSLLSEEFIRIVDSSTYGAKMPRASSEFINEMLLATPPLPEQTAIANFLDTRTAKIDTLIAKARQAIELMKERRTALISAAVTGKIDVRAFNEI